MRSRPTHDLPFGEPWEILHVAHTSLGGKEICQAGTTGQLPQTYPEGDIDVAPGLFGVGQDGARGRDRPRSRLGVVVIGPGEDLLDGQWWVAKAHYAVLPGCFCGLKPAG